MKGASVVRRLPTPHLGVAVALWFVAYFAVRVLLEDEALATSTRIMIALVPVPFFVLLVVSFIRAVLSIDEMQKKIQLEALAIAFTVTVFLLSTLGLLQHATELSMEDWSYTHVGFMIIISYFLSVGFVSGRYQ